MIRVPARTIYIGAAWLVMAGAGQGGTRLAWAEPPTISDVRIGFAGHYKVGYWTPVIVEVTGVAATADTTPGWFHFELEALDSDGVAVTYVGPPRRIDRTAQDDATSRSASATSTYIEYVKFGRQRNSLVVRLVSEAGKSEQKLTAADLAPGLANNQLLLVTLRDSVELEQAARLAFSPNEPQTSVVVADGKQLPDRWFGYEGVHTVVLTTSDFAWLDKLEPAQVEALDLWVRLGGRLVISAGPGAATMVARGPPWSDWLPGRFDEVAPLRRSSAIETYAAAEQRLGGSSRELGLDMALLSSVAGRVEASDTLPAKGDRPLVVRYPLGMGQAVFVTVDIDQSPMSEWTGRPRFLAKVLQNDRAPIDVPTRESQGQVTHLGFDDLVGQLRGAALDQFPGVTAVAFGWIVSLVVGYILILGPAEYFAHRRFGRAERTWITFPLLVLALSGLAIWMNGRFKEKRLRINQVDVVDVELATGMARGTTWANIYSPDSIRSDWSLSPIEFVGSAPSAERPECEGQWLVSWQGVPGRGVGGLGSSATMLLSGGSYATRLPVAPSLLDSLPPAESRELPFGSGWIESLPIGVASTRILSGRWQGTIALTNDCRLRSESLDGQLQGRLTNPWPFRLDDWALLRGNWMYRGDRPLESGDEYSLGEFSAVRYLDWHLTRRSVSTENKDVSTPWDEQSLDVSRIVEMMLFHRSAGGATYTHIGSRYQQYLDFTEPLRLGRAILVGRGPLACRPMRDGEPTRDCHDQQVAFYRLVLPVETAAAKAHP